MIAEQELITHEPTDIPATLREQPATNPLMLLQQADLTGPMKLCRSCNRTLPLSAFNKRSGYGQGRQGCCRLCGQKKRKAWYEKQGRSVIRAWHGTEGGKQKHRAIAKRYYAKHADKIKARSAVAHAIEAGTLPKASSLKCQCGQQASEYHHHKGYSPDVHLDVLPVCVACHRLENVRIRDGK